MVIEKGKRIGIKVLEVLELESLWLHAPLPDKNAGGTKGKVGVDTFEDLLGSQGFTFSSGKDSGPKTMAQMKKVELAKTMDPEKLKV